MGEALHEVREARSCYGLSVSAAHADDTCTATGNVDQSGRLGGVEKQMAAEALDPDFSDRTAACLRCLLWSADDFVKVEQSGVRHGGAQESRNGLACAHANHDLSVVGQTLRSRILDSDQAVVTRHVGSRAQSASEGHCYLLPWLGLCQFHDLVSKDFHALK